MSTTGPVTGNRMDTSASRSRSTRGTLTVAGTSRTAVAFFFLFTVAASLSRLRHQRSRSAPTPRSRANVPSGKPLFFHAASVWRASAFVHCFQPPLLSCVVSLCSDMTTSERNHRSPPLSHWPVYKGAAGRRDTRVRESIGLPR